MSKRTAYFPSGEIMECDCGKSAFRRHILVHQKYSGDDDRRVWFRPCEEWNNAMSESLDAWARSRGFASYNGYQTVKKALEKPEQTRYI